MFSRATERLPLNGGNVSRLWRLALGSDGRGFLRDGSLERATLFKSFLQSGARFFFGLAVKSQRASKRLAALKDSREGSSPLALAAAAITTRTRL